MSVNYKIHAINVNSLLGIPKRHFLADHLKKHKPDIVLISETCLKMRNKLNFHKYHMIRTDSGPGIRGTAILLKENMNFKNFFLPFNVNFEYTAAKIKTACGTIFLFSTYVHSTQLSDADSIDRIYNLLGPNDVLLLGGDFNARHVAWHNSRNNRNGNTLYNYLNCNTSFNNLKLVPSTSPSCHTANAESYIDLFLFSSSISSPSHSTNIEFNSDHDVVELWILLPRISEVSPPEIFDFSKTNWRLVNGEIDEILGNNMPPIKNNITTSEINEYVDLLESTTLRIVTKYTPKMLLNTKYNLKLNDLTLKCIREKKHLRRRWFLTGKRDNTIKACICRLSHIINELIKMNYNDKLVSNLKLIKPGPMLFRQVKNFANFTSKRLPILEDCADDETSALKLASHFYEIHNGAPASLSDGQVCPPNTFALELARSPVTPLTNFSEGILADGSAANTEISKNFTNFNTVKDLIKSRKNQKSAGTNQISNFILRKVPASFILFLTIILNHSINLSFFPNKWRHATVIPIPKGTTLTQDFRQYRPISLLSPLSKIFELLIKTKFQNCLERFSAFNRLQFGFTKGKSTGHALTYLLEDVHLAAYKKTPTLAVSIDLKKAFDTVWINGLIFKMKLLNFPLELTKLIFSFLSNRSFSLKFNNKVSHSFPIKAGVPQGSILGPILFNFFLYDFPIYANPEIKVLFYADDVLLYLAKRSISTMIGEIGAFLKVVQEYMDMWKLEINVQKCQAILFRKSDTHIAKPFKTFKISSNLKIPLGNDFITAEDNIKYLGIILNNKLSTIPHIKRLRALAMGMFVALKGIFSNKNIAVDVKVICYKQLIRSIITYGFVAWCHTSSHQMLLLRRLERKVLYRCLPFKVRHPFPDIHRLISRKQLFREFEKVSRLDTVLVGLFVRFFSKLEYSDLPELQRVTNTTHLMSNMELYINNKFPYKCFPPSLLYHLYLQGQLYNNGNLTFYNRRCHSSDLNNLVYDTID